MQAYNPEVDDYLENGCGRCKKWKTPDCKVHQWTSVLEELRALVLECGLVEERKWGNPCYTFNGKNVVMIAAFNAYCCLSFFKGALIDDPEGLLVVPGEESNTYRLAKFTAADQLFPVRDLLKSYVFQAIEIEKAGLKVKSKPVEAYAVPEEFQARMDGFPELQRAFEALTPGRRKSYLIYFGSAKQSKTRESRIDKCIPSIFAGKGYMEP